jgi:hypothetical protein
MTSSRLDNLVAIGQLKREPATRVLIRSGAARITDAENTSLSLDSRFDLAYNAAHVFSLAALRYRGYRSENRYTVFQALTDTLSLPAAQWRVLDQAHKLRNRAEYEGNVDLDQPLVEAVIRVAREIEQRIAALAPLGS